LVINYINNHNLDEIRYDKPYLDYISYYLQLFFDKKTMGKMSNNDRFILYNVVSTTKKFDFNNICVIDNTAVSEDFDIITTTNIVVDSDGETIIYELFGDGTWGQTKENGIRTFIDYLDYLDFVEWFRMDDCVVTMGVFVYAGTKNNCDINDMEFFYLCKYLYDNMEDKSHSINIYDKFDSLSDNKEKIAMYDCIKSNTTRKSSEHIINGRKFYLFYSL